jgi:hypothetical protein
MARYKTIDTSPRFIAVDLERQLLPGTFEHALNYLVDHQLDLSRFDTRYKNDLTGASAYPPAMLLKVVLFAYSRGIVSSRDIERACRDHVTFIALSGDSAPHFTTFAGFVSTLARDRPAVQGSAAHLRPPGAHRPRDVRHRRRQATLQRQQGQERHPCRLPASGREDGSRGEGHAGPPPRERRPTVRTDLAEKEARQIERLTREAAQMRQWLSANPDERRGAKGKVIKSNRTDPDSAKMATSKGVIQGYTGVAAVDDRHQIIVEAQAHGTGSEQALLMPMVKAAAPLCTPDTLITADAGYHSDANLKALAEQDRPALIADNQMRKRDERFKDQAKYKAQPDPLYDKAHPKKTAGHYRPKDFDYDPEAGTCRCPGRASCSTRTDRTAITTAIWR